MQNYKQGNIIVKTLTRHSASPVMLELETRIFLIYHHRSSQVLRTSADHTFTCLFVGDNSRVSVSALFEGERWWKNFKKKIVTCLLFVCLPFNFSQTLLQLKNNFHAENNILYIFS